MKSVLVTIATLALLTACGKKEEPVATPAPAPVVAPAPAAPASAPAAPVAPAPEAAKTEEAKK